MIYAPVNDFRVIIAEQGQPVTIKRVVRTIDSNGKTTGISTTDVETTAVVDEWKSIVTDVNGASRVIYGDTKFSLLPEIEITTFDKIIWENKTFVVKKIDEAMKIAGSFCYRIVQCNREQIP